MKTFSKIVVAAVAVLAMSSMALAQKPGPTGGKGVAQGGRPGGPGGRGEMMKAMADIQKKVLDQLNLTADQKTKIAALDKTRAASMQKLMAGAQKGGGDRQAMQEQGRKIQAEYRNSLKGVLGDAKFKTYEKLMKAEREKWMKAHGIQPRGGAGGPGGGKPAGGGGKPAGGGGGA